MESVLEFLNDLADKGIKLSVDGDVLNCYVQKGSLTRELKDGITQHKSQIMSFLRNANPPRSASMDPAAAAAVTQFPLGVGQRTHYLLQMMNPDKSYAVPIALKIAGNIDCEMLEKAWACVLRQYPLLTARIIDNAGVLYHVLDEQCVSKMGREKVDCVDDAQLVAHLQSKVLIPFDLSAGPLTRIDLLTQPDQGTVLFIVVHHIIFDGFSVGVLLKALFGFYEQLSQGKTVSISRSMPGYHAFVAWEEAMLESKEGRRHAEYWQRQLKGELPGFKLLPDAARSMTAQQEEAKVLVRALPEEMVRWVREFSKATSLQPSAICLGIFQLLLHKYTNQEDIIVSTPAVVRPGEQFANEVGYLFNIVPIRTDFSAKLDLEGFLRKVQMTLIDAMYHASYPLSLMMQAKSKAEHAGDFNVFFAFQSFGNLSDAASTLPMQEALGLSQFDSFHQKAEGELDLAFEMFEKRDGGLTIHVQSNPAMYSNDTVDAFCEHYLALMGRIAENPALPVHQYAMVTEREALRVTCRFNATQADFPRDKCIHDFFAERVAAHPAKTAVTCGDQSLTYQELYDKSSDLALYLQSRGVGPDSIVGLCVERSLEMMLGIMGIVQAGGAYLPLDPEYPEDRLSYMMKDSNSPIFLTQEKFRAKLEALCGSDTPVMTLDTQAPDIAADVKILKDAGTKLRHDVRPNNIDYVIYTSGSTGNPKGVMVEHSALVNRINWMQKMYALGPDDVVLQKTPYSFDVSVWEFFWPMMAGAAVVFAKPEGHMDVHYLEDLINEAGVTTLHYVPSMLHAFIDNARAVCRSVRQVFCSGEALDKRSVDRYQGRFPNALLHNLYGPTEAAIDVTYFDCSDLRYPFVPIGAPIDNTQIYILDKYNNPQPIGVPGELHIAGDGLARGYLNRPELTLEKFVANPFDPGKRMYKTGDLACWLEDGNIQYLGRIDVQVKIGGVRIETGEIEAHLNQHPGISESVVIAHGADGYKQLIAFYRAVDSSSGVVKSLPHHELRGHLLATLPEYMIPAAFVSIASIPLSSNGKVDRRALERMEVKIESTCEYLAPSNATEQQLVDLWTEVFKEQGFVLEKAKIGVNDNFFELGGNSLLATQLIYKIRWHLGVDLPVRALFEQTNIARLAEFVGKLERNDALPAEIVVDLGAEAVLDPDIKPAEAKAPSVDVPAAKAIFLTGASGFLGAYLLRDLIKSTEARVYCLVRCRTESDGMKRLKNNLANYGLWREEFAERIVAVAGDLAQPLLGVGAAMFDSLCATMDVIYHNGAMVNFIYPYASLKSPNVGGTQEVIRLASRAKLKALHFISTGSVFPPSKDGMTRILETDPLGSWEGVLGGYAQTKWVAEKLVGIAAERGLPVRVYRPGTVAGDSATGICNTGDFIPRLLKSSIQLGMAPDTDAMVGMVPVDYVSKAIVELSRQRDVKSNVFHIVNPRLLLASELAGMFNSLGFPMKVVPYAEWRDALLEDAKMSSKNALFPLLPLFTDDNPMEREAVFDCAQTLDALRGSLIACPTIDTSLMATYLTYMRNSGFLSA